MFKNKINKYIGILLSSIIIIFSCYGASIYNGNWGGIFTGTGYINNGSISNVSSYFMTSTQTSSYSLTTNDNTIILNGSSLTATLPTAVGIQGKMYNIININSSSQTISSSGGTIGGSSTYTLSSQYNAVSVVSDGANWQIISSH